MKYVIRAWGLHYEYHPVHKEVWSLGWVDKQGRVSSDRRQVHKFDSADDAWSFAVAADLVGHDSMRGDWCTVEEVDDNKSE